MLLQQLGPADGKRCLLVTNGDNNGALNWHFRARGGDWTWVENEASHIGEMEQLLGQPVIRGGWIGLFVHAGLLLFALAAIERLNADPHTLSAVVTGALLPWLIDFDQDFALYIANAVKFALVMVVVIIPVAMTEKHRSSVPG